MNYNDPLEGDFTDDTETAAMLVGRSRAACALGGDIFLHVADTVATLSRHLMFHHNGFRTCHIAILLGHIIGPLDLSVSTVDKILTSEDKESFPAALYRARVASNSTNYPVRRAGEYVFQRVSAATRFPSVPSFLESSSNTISEVIGLTISPAHFHGHRGFSRPYGFSRFSRLQALLKLQLELLSLRYLSRTVSNKRRLQRKRSQ